MPRRLRRTTRRRSYRRRTLRRRYRRRGKARAAAGQKQLGRFVIKSSQVGSIIISAQGITKGEDYRPNYAGTAVISAYQNLARSNHFQSLAAMYDQVKLDWVKVKISPTVSVLIQGASQGVFISAWDRNGITQSTSPPSFSEIASYGSAFQRSVNMTATTWSATRKIAASSLQEKSVYMPTTLFKTAQDIGRFTLGKTSIEQNSWLAWNPQLLIGLMSMIGSPTVGNMISGRFTSDQAWSCVFEFTWGLTFRGLRYDHPYSIPLTNAIMTLNTTAAVNTGKYDDPPGDDAMDEYAPGNGETTAYAPGALGPSQFGQQVLCLDPQCEADSFLRTPPSFYYLGRYPQIQTQYRLNTNSYSLRGKNVNNPTAFKFVTVHLIGIMDNTGRNQNIYCVLHPSWYNINVTFGLYGSTDTPLYICDFIWGNITFGEEINAVPYNGPFKFKFKARREQKETDVVLTIANIDTSFYYTYVRSMFSTTQAYSMGAQIVTPSESSVQYFTPEVNQNLPPDPIKGDENPIPGELVTG